MKLVRNITAMMAIMLVSAFADNMPVQGSGSGTFSSVTAGTASGNTWTYDTGGLGASTLRFTGSSFGLSLDPLCGGVCFTPVTVDLGTLTDANNITDNSQRSSTGSLAIDVNFTVPSGGGPATFAGFNVQMNEGSGALHLTDNVTDLTNFEGPSTSVIIGNEAYTITLDGFTQNTLGVSLPPNGSAPGPTSPVLTSMTTTGLIPVDSADLWATITSSPVPEPGSILLLGSIAGLLALVLRKSLKALQN